MQENILREKFYLDTTKQDNLSKTEIERRNKKKSDFFTVFGRFPSIQSIPTSYIHKETLR